MASAIAGLCCGSRLRENNSTRRPFLNASRRIPSSLRSKIHSGPAKRLSVRVAAMGTTHSGNDGLTTGIVFHVCAR